MLKEFSVQQYRNVKVRDIALEPLNVLIGPNNSGKSNLIDAMSLFANMVVNKGGGGGFHEFLMKRGWSDVLDRNEEPPAHVELKWVLDGDEGFPELVYELDFVVGLNSQIPHGFFVANESLRNDKPIDTQYDKPFEFFRCHTPTLGKGWFSVKKVGQGRKSQRLQLDVEPSDSVFLQIEKLLSSKEFRMDFYPNFIRTVNYLRNYLDRFKSYASTKFDVERIRQPVTIDMTAKYLNQNGSNFANVVANMDRNYPDFIDNYTVSIRRIIPGLNKIRVVPITESTIQVELIIDGKRFKLHEMSDGTVKALVIALILQTPERMSLLAIDEPELNLHPAWIRTFSEWIVRCSAADQVFVSTHSPDLLDALTEKFQTGGLGLFVTQIGSETSVRRVFPDELQEKFSEGWELGDLYRVGDVKLGGWPW